MLDGDAPLLAVERERLARRDGAGSFPVEVIDHGSWQAMQRLAERGDLPAEALSTLTALWSEGGRGGPDVAQLAEATGRVIAAI